MSELLKALSQNTGRRYKCGFGDWYRSCTEEEQQAIHEAMLDKTKSNQGLYRIFTKHGLKATSNTMPRHRQGPCKTCGLDFSSPN